MASEKLDKQAVFERVVRKVETLMETSRAEEEDKPVKISEDTDVFSDLSIDSVEVMDLLVALETEFQILMNLEEVGKRRKIGEFVDIVWEKLKD